MIKFILGESRTLQFEVLHQKDEDFIIASCEYSIVAEDEIIESGQMDIDGHMMSIHFTPERVGNYILSFFYTIAGERHAGRYHITVAE